MSSSDSSDSSLAASLAGAAVLAAAGAADSAATGAATTKAEGSARNAFTCGERGGSYRGNVLWPQGLCGLVGVK